MVERAIRQSRAGLWGLHDCAAYLHCDKAHVVRILRGVKRQDVMRAVDPSSLAPTFIQPTRPTICTHCDRGVSWVRLHTVTDSMGRTHTYCPTCGRSA